MCRIHTTSESVESLNAWHVGREILRDEAEKVRGCIDEVALKKKMREGRRRSNALIRANNRRVVQQEDLPMRSRLSRRMRCVVRHAACSC